MPASYHDYGRVFCIGSLANLASNILVHRFPTYSFYHGMLVMTEVYANTGHFLTIMNIKMRAL
jgi:hypothetical protein